MIFERIEEEGLSHYSYVIGSKKPGTVAIVDPRRDVDVYIEYAREKDLRISHVLETHIHADLCSGARELAERVGAKHCASGHDRGEEFEVSFEHQDLEDGDKIELGEVRIEVIHSPGHTPEHITFVAFDGERSRDVPVLLLTGDFLMVGSIGRPDLLGEDEKKALARRAWESVQRLADLPDGVEVHPAHGAGSMCGAGMAGRATSTLGFERATNPYLSKDLTEETFVEKLLSDPPPMPEYYKRMKVVNSKGPARLDGIPGQHPIEVEAFGALVKGGEHVVIDLRHHHAFGGAHVPGAFGIGAVGKLSMWAGWVVPYETPILLVAAKPEDVEDAARALVRVGLDDVKGFLEGGMESWMNAGRAIESIPQLDVHTLAKRLGADAPVVLDVRTDEEWKEGHVEGAIHIMGGELQERFGEVPADRQIAVICGSGYRSTVAASILARRGLTDLRNVTGGMTAWKAAGLPVDKKEPAKGPKPRGRSAREPARPRSDSGSAGVSTPG